MPLLTLPPTPSRTFNVQSFDSTSTFTVPSSSTGFIDIIMCAGGGGAGKSNNTNCSGGAGAGGQIVFLQNVAVPLGQVITITIGAGGAGATSAGSAGTNGSDTTVTNLGALTFATSLTASGGARGVTNTDTEGIVNFTVYGQYPNSTNYWGPNSQMGATMTSINAWSTYFNSQHVGSNGQSTPNWWQSTAPLVGPSTVQLYGNGNPGFYGFLPKAYQTKQGSAGVSASTTGGASTASTTLFAGRGATGGHGGASNGGTGLYGGGGGGGGSNSGPTLAGAGGNGGANSGGGGGSGGGNSVTAGNSGNGGTGGSGFVVIGYWG
jgi:hypothetical protein